jgi:hypothetical protein
MTAMAFTKATKKKAKLRLAIMSPSGYGKTYTALAIGTELGQRVAVIDTERGSSELYSGRFSFDVLNLDTFSPQSYIDAIHAAEKAGYDVLIIDSLSHGWSGIGGALEQVDNAAARSTSKNKFTAWREVTPLHNAMVDAILRSPMHIIATMRVKTEWVLEEDERGKKHPVKKGLQPIQRDGLEYEFTVVADMHENHSMTVSKTRCEALDGKLFRKPGKDVADILVGWLNDGAEPGRQATPPPAPDSKTRLEKQLEASVDANWGKWLQTAEESLRMGAKDGRLLEAWTSVVDDANRLCPPSPVLNSIKAIKDDLKKMNGKAAQ